jgi:hypothetical protein
VRVQTDSELNGSGHSHNDISCWQCARLILICCCDSQLCEHCHISEASGIGRPYAANPHCIAACLPAIILRQSLVSSLIQLPCVCSYMISSDRKSVRFIQFRLSVIFPYNRGRRRHQPSCYCGLSFFTIEEGVDTNLLVTAGV